MTRRILITLGSTTDAERCGDCPRVNRRYWQCDLFLNGLHPYDATFDDRKRLPECIAAEKAAEEAGRG